MGNAGSAGLRSREQQEEFRITEDDWIRPEDHEAGYLQLSCEAAERVEMLTSPDHSRSLHLNQAQCRLLADALSKAVHSAKQDVCGLDAASVQLFAPAFRELCRVACDCEKLVRDCCKKNWLPVVLKLADSRQEFLLRMSELKWCARAWRTILKHGLQGGAWLKQFHKCSQVSVADRSCDMSDEAEGLRIAFEEDLETLRAKLAEMKGNVDVEEEVRELAGHVLSRCETISAVRLGYNEDERIKYELPESCRGKIKVICMLGVGVFGSVLQMSWFKEGFAVKVIYDDLEVFGKEVGAMIKINGHPRIVNFLGVLLSYPTSISNAIVMELMPSDLWTLLMNKRQRERGGEKCSGCGPFSLDVAVDIMLQVAEGVEVLHKVQLFHRDVKSPNILVEPVELQPLRDAGYVRVKLADFGLTEARSTTFGENRKGTYRWTAPEIESGCDDVLVYPAKADVFSYAILCSEILSGDIPFHDILTHCNLEHVKNLLQEGVRPELPLRLPSQLASLVQRCWDTEPTKRPTFAAICKELRYLKFLITIGGVTQFRALDVPDKDEEMIAEIVKHLRWIDQYKLHLVRHLGSGGFGSVNECEWQGRRVAVKNLSRVGKEDVEREAALLVRVQHPNVVKLIGCTFIEEEEKGMIVMELMDQDLHHLINDKMRAQSGNGPPFSSSVALDIMLKVATAMKHVRDCNVLHRDLKTSNILVKTRTESQAHLFRRLLSRGRRASHGTPDDVKFEVKLADFGLSKYKSKGSRFTTKPSEAHYWRAPETSEAGNYSWQADVFSFGVVCYEVLSGEVPFGGKQGPELIRLVREGKRPEIPSCCPKTLADLVNKCWATNPEDRPEFAEICLTLGTCHNDL